MSSLIHTTLGYLVPSKEKPIYIASEGGADAQLDISAQFAQHDVIIRDARDIEHGTSLDKEGFALTSHLSSISDFYDDDLVREIYEAEATELVQRETGASHVVVFDNTRRSDATSIRGARNIREPSAVIHNDYTDDSARQRVRDILPVDEAAYRLQRRFAIINIWRSIAGPVITTPLALCDATTIAEPDLVASERRAKERVGELQLVTHNPDHRWYWFSAMTRDEALLIKTYDSELDGRARRSIHTAFVNPDAPPGTAPRESIETRTLVFFD